MRSMGHPFHAYGKLFKCKWCLEWEYTNLFGLCRKCRRACYHRFVISRRKEYGIPFSVYMMQKQVRLKTKRPRKYFLEKAKLQRALATPKWIDVEEIAEFYAECPPQHHVDHLVPINGKNVCGLHVRCNLRYLVDSHNMIKGNSFARE